MPRNHMKFGLSGQSVWDGGCYGVNIFSQNLYSKTVFPNVIESEVGLWEVIRVRRGHEGEVSMMGLVSL